MYDIADFAALAPRFSGSISAVSSSLILFLIYRSNVKLSTIYHRIMFGMSLADVFASTAMALTTLPMPRSDDPYWVALGEEHWVEQTKIGNVQTCAAQGFFFSTGMLVMFGYNGSLCFYYACAIAFQMKEAKIKKRIEPFLHAFPLLSGFVMVGPSFYLRMYNAIAFEAWCTFRPMAQFLDSKLLHRWSRIVEECTLWSSVILLLSIFLFFLCIIVRVCHNARQVKRILKSPQVCPRSNKKNSDIALAADKIVNGAHRNSKLIVIQSLAYIGAFCLTLMFPIMNYILTLFYPGRSRLSILSTKMMIVFLPLQGFFNFLIFFWHKFENYHRAHPDKSICEIVKHLFSSNAQEPVILSRISMVRFNEADHVMEIQVENEQEDSFNESRFDLFDSLDTSKESNYNEARMNEPSIDDLPSGGSSNDPSNYHFYQSPYSGSPSNQVFELNKKTKSCMRRKGRHFPAEAKDITFDEGSFFPESLISVSPSSKSTGADATPLDDEQGIDQDLGVMSDFSHRSDSWHGSGAGRSDVFSTSYAESSVGRGVGVSIASSGIDTRRKSSLEASPGTCSLNQDVEEQIGSIFPFESSKESSAKSPGALGTIHKEERDGRVSVISELSEDTLDKVINFRKAKIAQMFRSRTLFKNKGISPDDAREKEQRSKVFKQGGIVRNSGNSANVSPITNGIAVGGSSDMPSSGVSSGVSSGGAMRIGQTRSFSSTSANKTGPDSIDGIAMGDSSGMSSSAGVSSGGAMGTGQSSFGSTSANKAGSDIDEGKMKNKKSRFYYFS